MDATKKIPYSVNLNSPIAVYVQIENLVRFAIASGRLKAGETLPSVREMSTVLDINPNTVTKAYRDLELMGLVHTRRGVGVTVAKDAPGKCTKDAQKMAVEHLREAVAECLASGLPATELRKVLMTTLDEQPLPYGMTPDGRKK